jgi:hypothetical protein
MRKFAALAILWCLLSGGPPAAAQHIEQMPKLQRAVRNGWLQFDVVLGRIVLESSRVYDLSLPSGSEKNKESLSIRWGNEKSAVEYEWIGPQEQIVLKTAGNRRIEIRRNPRDGSAAPPVVFLQNLQENLVLTVGSGDAARHYAAPTLWHLVLAHPDETRRHLLPCLELLQSPGEKLSETAAGLETELLRKASSGIPGIRSQWKRWVAQLGDETFAKRQEADRALRAGDPAVLSYLRQLDFRRLDAEQQFRVERIIAAFSRHISDESAEQTASWLAGDPAVWLALAARPDASLRRAAVDRLEALLEEPVALDLQSDPATQKARLEQLRRRLEE